MHGRPAEARYRPAHLQDVRSGLDLDEPSLEVPTIPTGPGQRRENLQLCLFMKYSTFLCVRNGVATAGDDS